MTINAGTDMMRGHDVAGDGGALARGVWDGDGGDVDPTADEGMPPCSVWRQRVRLIKRAQHWGGRWLQGHRLHEGCTEDGEGGRARHGSVLTGGLVAEFGGRYR